MSISDVDAKRIWNAYEMYSRTAYVVRTGFQCFGLTQPYDRNWLKRESDIFFERGQSSAEHQANVAFLCSVFSSNFPAFFKQEVLSAQDFQYLWVLTTVALLHDVPEGVIGDICDDGRPEHAAKDKKEGQIYNKFVEMGFNRNDAKALIDGFNNFQEKRGSIYSGAYALDKADAVLTLIFLEKHDCIGNIKAKDQPTPLDRETMRVTGTTNPVDCLALHLKMIFEYYHMPESITEPIYAVIRAAIIDVRGSFFKWWDAETPDLGNFISSPRR